jgi:hypothetical protein
MSIAPDQNAIRRGLYERVRNCLAWFLRSRPDKHDGPGATLSGPSRSEEIQAEVASFIRVEIP